MIQIGPAELPPSINISEEKDPPRPRRTDRHRETVRPARDTNDSPVSPTMGVSYGAAAYTATAVATAIVTTVTASAAATAAATVATTKGHTQLRRM